MMKFNWGHGITAGYVLFVGYILYFVFTSFNQDIDLVADDYYAQEVAFQDRIDQTANAQLWDDSIVLSKTEQGLVLSFPEAAQADFQNGLIYFFRPSDADMDLKLPVQLNDQGHFIIPYQLLKDGRYEAQISWEGEEKKYFLKRTLFI